MGWLPYLHRKHHAESLPIKVFLEAEPQFADVLHLVLTFAVRSQLKPLQAGLHHFGCHQEWKYTSGSLTQSSILNMREGLVSKDRVQSILSMLTTTSTSYLLLASLDVARKRLATEGHQLAEETLKLANQTRDRLNQIEGIILYRSESSTSILKDSRSHFSTSCPVRPRLFTEIINFVGS